MDFSLHKPIDKEQVKLIYLVFGYFLLEFRAHR